MQSIIIHAINLRQEERFADSITELEKLVDDENYSGQAFLQIAWNYDAQGLEREAIPNYKKALDGILSYDNKFDCLLGLASSLRCIGNYSEADIYFKLLLSEYQDKDEVIPFYAMNLYNLGNHKKSVQLLIQTLLKTTNSDDIKAYKNAISIYAQNLDQTW
ncbi:tetratricopeptide repeat protein [Endozoicomonas acroporae]|uniref:tetratricopeptide repeat protein n=1 Tax=Endozoicomonas acroporae TaxID=1701104 RepID=UPI0013D11437|nr:tetratricopeptide repeat protein [Endozoicomonas acroporae]